jgi:hypothetical protein
LQQGRIAGVQHLCCLPGAWGPHCGVCEVGREGEREREERERRERKGVEG